MTIVPIHHDEAQVRHWVVRWLRNIGYAICGLSALYGAFFAVNSSAVISMSMSVDSLAWLFHLILLLLGGLIGFVVGLAISLPWWGIALVIDDLHAIRLYAAGYWAFRDDDDTANASSSDPNADPFDLP